MAQIRPSNIERGGKHIPAPTLPPDAKLEFSFRHLDIISNPKFGLHHCESGYLEKFLLRLKDLNSTTVKSFRELPNKQVRNHKIVFSGTTEPSGFPVSEQLKSEEAWQFQLTKSEHGRVHGLLIGDSFHIVWLDPCHLLYEKNSKCTHDKG